MKRRTLFLILTLIIVFSNFSLSQNRDNEVFEELKYFIDNEEYESAFDITKDINLEKFNLSPTSKFKLYQMVFETNIAMGNIKEADEIADRLVAYSYINFRDTSFYFGLRYSCKIVSTFLLNDKRKLDSLFKIFNQEILTFLKYRDFDYSKNCDSNYLYNNFDLHQLYFIARAPMNYHEFIVAPLYYIDKIRNFTKYEDLNLYILKYIESFFGKETYAYYWTKLYYHEDQLRYGFLKEAKTGFNEVLHAITDKIIGVFDQEIYTPTHDLQRTFLYSGQIDSSIFYDNEMEKFLFLGSKTEVGNKFMKRGFLNNLIGKYDLSKIQLFQAINIFNVNFDNIDSILATYNESYISMNYYISLFASSRLFLGTLLLNLQEYKKSEDLLIEAFKIASKGSGINLQRKREILQRLAIVYQEMNNWQKADSVFNILLQDDFRSINKSFYNQTEVNRSIQYNKLKQDFDIYINYCLKKLQFDTNAIGKIQNLILKTKGLIFYSGKSIKQKIENSLNKEQKEKLVQINKLDEKLAKIGNSNKGNSIKSANIDSLLKFKNSIEKELYQSIDLFADEYLRRNADWKDIRAKLSQNEATIEIIRVNPFDQFPNKFNRNECSYDFSDSLVYYIAIIIKKNSTKPEYVIFENGKELEYSLYQQYSKVIKPDIKKLSAKEYELYTKNYKSVLKKLYKSYWSEIDKKLNGIEKIYTSFDGIYNVINLNILIDHKDKYLIDKYEFVLMTSLRDFISSHEISIKKIFNTAALFGNPDYNYNFASNTTNKDESEEIAYNLLDINRGDKYRGSYDTLWPKLVASEKEVKSISKILKAKKEDIKVFVKSDASKKNLLNLDSPSILHIATHGFYKQYSDNENYSFNNTFFENQRNPLLNTGLIFAGANTFLRQIKTNYLLAENFEDDGIMTAFEAMNMKLENTNLVVLSACESGLGDIKYGEGVYGLQRAFKFAGAKNVLMSYWNINDEDTKNFMEKFYKKLASTNNISKSLRSSILEFKNQFEKDNPYNHPKFWGAFMLTSSEK